MLSDEIDSKVWIVIVGSIVLFLLHRHFVRGWVLQRCHVRLAIIIVNSFPNFIEAIFGTINVAAIAACIAIRRNGPAQYHESAASFNWISTITAAFVVTQELNWFSVTRLNVYDPYDVVASILGLVLINRILVRTGFLKCNANKA